MKNMKFRFHVKFLNMVNFIIFRFFDDVSICDSLLDDVFPWEKTIFYSPNKNIFIRIYYFLKKMLCFSFCYHVNILNFTLVTTKEKKNYPWYIYFFFVSIGWFWWNVKKNYSEWIFFFSFLLIFFSILLFYILG